jgi:hypothetical protein
MKKSKSPSVWLGFVVEVLGGCVVVDEGGAVVDGAVVGGAVVGGAVVGGVVVEGGAVV